MLKVVFRFIIVYAWNIKINYFWKMSNIKIFLFPRLNVVRCEEYRNQTYLKRNPAWNPKTAFKAQRQRFNIRPGPRDL